MLLKTTSPGCGVRAPLMLLLLRTLIIRIVGCLKLANFLINIEYS